jgi:peroxiredoxin
VPASDLGVRPPIETLGPFRWTPQVAEPWTLTDAEGRTIGLGDFRGRPVVVIFYLGYGCLHCVEQLNAFAPKAREFADAGISLVAISTDPKDQLKQSLQQCRLEGGFPFPLVSDASLGAFKAYRCHDDFENAPLHGTFLIDAEGRVRWQDIGFEPFTKPEFLLQEAKRLLPIR